MAIRVVRLGSARAPGEGLRLGTVRRPPRGVAKTRFPTENWYDVWFPVLAPSVSLLKQGRHVATGAGWRRFSQRYRTEMKRSEASQALDLLAALSHHANFSVGCYCEDESRCHRTLLRVLLVSRGAHVV